MTISQIDIRPLKAAIETVQILKASKFTRSISMRSPFDGHEGTAYIVNVPGNTPMGTASGYAPELGDSIFINIQAFLEFKEDPNIDKILKKDIEGKPVPTAMKKYTATEFSNAAYDLLVHEWTHWNAWKLVSQWLNAEVKGLMEDAITSDYRSEEIESVTQEFVAEIGRLRFSKEPKKLLEGYFLYGKAPDKMHGPSRKIAADVSLNELGFKEYAIQKEFERLKDALEKNPALKEVIRGRNYKIDQYLKPFLNTISDEQARQAVGRVIEHLKIPGIPSERPEFKIPSDAIEYYLERLESLPLKEINEKPDNKSNNQNPPMKAVVNGGIDLSSDKALRVQNSGEAIKFNLDPAMLQQLKSAPGFKPLIINMQSLADLRSFLEN